ncbi:MAG: hypothetical protein CL610_04345 [Anaerolineaceae bacterium]|nr:hypothetical protein [Anaerolineaceae bacterium]
MSRLIAFILGMVAGLFFGRLMSPPPIMPPPAKTPVPASKPRAPEPKRAPTPDALTEIDGIGPAFAQALNAIGIHTFAELARQNPDDLAAQLPARINADRIRRDGWIEQAQRLANEQSDA